MMLQSIIGIITGNSSGGSAPPPATNTITAIWTEDIARDWVRVEFENSIGVTAPALSQISITGKTVTEVVMRFNKVLYVKVNSDFSEGADIDFTYTRIGSLLGGLGSQTIPVTNYITDAVKMTWALSDYFLNVDTDFPHNNKIIVVPAGFYGSLDIGRGENITFVMGDDGDVHFDYCNFREAVLNYICIGHPARVKNLKIHNPTPYSNFGIGCFATGNIRIEDFEIYNVVQGIQVKTVSDIDEPPYNLSRTNHQTVSIKRGRIANCSQEALYIGSDVAAPLIPINWTIHDIELEDIGRDGVQVRNGSGEVRRVTAVKNVKDYAIGWEENAVHAHFLAYGETTTSGLFEDCTCNDGVYGNFLFINGYGGVTVRRCSGSSNLNAVYINNYGDHDEYDVGGKTVTFEGINSFTTDTGGDPRALDARRDVLKTNITLNINPETTFNNPVYIEDGDDGPDNGIVTNYT